MGLDMSDKASFINIIYRLYLIFNNSADIADWLNAPIKALDDRPPLYWISQGRIDMVENLLKEIECSFTF